MNIYGQKKGLRENTATRGKDKKRNQSYDNLKKIMMKNKIRVVLVGTFQEFQ